MIIKIKLDVEGTEADKEFLSSFLKAWIKYRLPEEVDVINSAEIDVIK